MFKMTMDRDSISKNMNDESSLEAMSYFNVNKVIYECFENIIPLAYSNSLTPAITEIVVNGSEYYNTIMTNGGFKTAEEFKRIYLS